MREQRKWCPLYYANMGDLHPPPRTRAGLCAFAHVHPRDTPAAAAPASLESATESAWRNVPGAHPWLAPEFPFICIYFLLLPCVRGGEERPALHGPSFYIHLWPRPSHPPHDFAPRLRLSSAGPSLPTRQRCVSARPRTKPRLPVPRVQPCPVVLCHPRPLPDRPLGQGPAAAHRAGEATGFRAAAGKLPTLSCWNRRKGLSQASEGETWRQGVWGAHTGAREGSLPLLVGPWLWQPVQPARGFSLRACPCPDDPIYEDMGHIRARATLRLLNQYHLQQPCIQISHTASWGLGPLHRNLEGRTVPTTGARGPAWGPAAVISHFPLLRLQHSETTVSYVVPSFVAGFKNTALADGIISYYANWLCDYLMELLFCFYCEPFDSSRKVSVT